MERPRFRIYADGGARGNPGPAAIGIVLCDPSEVRVNEHREYIGEGTNNEAEYRALIKGLELATRHTRGDVLFVSDSELVIRQMRGEYVVREPRLQELNAKARALAAGFRSVVFEHRPRLSGWLARADALVNEALDLAAESRGKG